MTTTRGPLPRSVYWRRRAFVLGATLALLLIAVNLVRGVGGGEPRASTDTALQAAGTPTEQTTDGTDGTGNGHHRGKRSKNKQGATTGLTSGPTSGPTLGPAQPVLVQPTGACDDDDVTVTPQVLGGTVGTSVPITLVLRTKAAAACTWTVSAKDLALKVTRFGNEIWSSRLCPQQVPLTSVVVRQAVTSTLEVTWSGRRAETGCPRLTDPALPGHYQIEAAAVGGLPATDQFALAPRPAAAPGSTTGTGTGTGTGTPGSTPTDQPTSTGTAPPATIAPTTVPPTGTSGPSPTPTSGGPKKR